MGKGKVKMDKKDSRKVRATTAHGEERKCGSPGSVLSLTLFQESSTPTATFPSHVVAVK